MRNGFRRHRILWARLRQGGPLIEARGQDMQRVMSGLAMLLSVAVLALMAVDLRRFIVEQHIAPFTVDSPLAFIIFVMSLLTVFIVINGI